MNYKLILENNILEVEEMELSGVSIALNRQYEALSNPTLYLTDWSKSVNIPFTETNNKIFSNIFRLDSLVTNQTIDPRKKIQLILLYDNEIITRGYAKLTNIYNDSVNKYYQLNLYSTLGGLLNDMKQLTFNQNADVESKYKIPNPLKNNLQLNRHIVKESFEKSNHVLNLVDKSDLDIIGFFPQYQGKYSDFDSDKYDFITSIQPYPYGERDEHYTREFRSYYQGCYVYINALWQLVKQHLESITDYKINLDKSFFNKNNPYYTNVIYTVPSLYDTTGDSDNTDKTKKELYKVYNNAYKSNTTVLADCSNKHTKTLPFNRNSGHYIYNADTKFFNLYSGFSTHFNAFFVYTLHASLEDGITSNYARIRDNNPLFLRIKAVNANSGRDITGASHTFMFYSGETDVVSGFNTAIDIGVADRDYPRVVTMPEIGYDKTKGFFWGGELQVSFDINSSEPFRIVAEQWTYNNDKPFEYAVGSFIPTWDWLWKDFFQTTTTQPNQTLGLTWWLSTVRASVESTVNIRSNSLLDINRVWSKDESIFNVLLKYAKMFHLVFDLDEEKKVLNICSRERYFSNYTIEDWTDKVDRLKEFKHQPIFFDSKYLKFTYDEGKGHRFDYYQSKYGANYGEYKLNTLYQFSTNETNLIEGIGSSMISTKKQDSSALNTTNPNNPNFLGYDYKILPNEYFVENDNNGSIANNYGAFYFHNGTYNVDSRLSAKNNNGNPVVFISDDSENMIKGTTYCWGGEQFVTCSKFPSISTYSADGKLGIHFQAPKELYFNKSVVPYDSPTYIYENYWEKYLNERYSVQNKLLTAYFYISPMDYKNYKFNKFIKIDNNLYLPNKIIDYDLSSKQSTKIELLQVSDITAYTNGEIVFPYLYTERELININTNVVKEFVFSSTEEWSILNRPFWFSAVNDNGYLRLQATNETFTERSGYVILRNTDGCLWTIKVIQKATESYLRVNPNTLLFNYNGGSQRVAINSNPETITVTDKPSWVNTSLLQLINNQYTLIVSANANTTSLAKSGYITLSNGLTTAQVRVTIQGKYGTDIEVPNPNDPDTPIVINPNDPNVPPIIIGGGGGENPTPEPSSCFWFWDNGDTMLWDNANEIKLDNCTTEENDEDLIFTEGEITIVTNKPIDPNRIFVSGGSITIPQSDKPLIGKVPLFINPDKSTTGGVIKLYTIDGEPITINYNTTN